MRRFKKSGSGFAALLVAALLLFTGISAEAACPVPPLMGASGRMVLQAGTAGQSGAQAGTAGQTGAPAGSSGQAALPADSAYHEDKAEGTDTAKIDLSSTADGIVAVSVVSSKKCKFQAIMGEQTYTYDVASDGTPGIFPVQCGNGTYTFRILENVTGSKYGLLYTTEADVTLTDEFQPFLRPSDYSDYSAESLCVKKAAELAANCKTDNDVVKAIYDFVCKTVVYDREKAANLQVGYMPVPDETMTTGKGICFDYASLAAAMLRSQGIPTKLVFGYVAPDDLYHAWNMFYTEETGWVTVDYQVSKDTWNRIDLAFSANGADGKFIGNGSNYADLYYY